MSGKMQVMPDMPALAYRIAQHACGAARLAASHGRCGCCTLQHGWDKDRASGRSSSSLSGKLQVVVLPDMPESADLALRADLLAVLRGQQARVAASAAAPRAPAGRARNAALAAVDSAADCICLITDDKEFGAELRQAQVRPRPGQGFM